VYEAVNLKGELHGDAGKGVAVKILNPVGFKLLPSAPLQRFIVARKGAPLPAGPPPGSELPQPAMGPEHVWWLVHPGNRSVVVAAHLDARSGQLRELPLPRCVEVWGWDPLGEGLGGASDDPPEGGPEDWTPSSRGGQGGGGASREPQQRHGHPHHSRGHHAHHSSATPPPHHRGFDSDEAYEKWAKAGGEVVHVEALGGAVTLPRVPPKFLRWLRARQGIWREIANMAHLGRHENVVSLLEVLEFVQDSKATLFLVLELVTGGELFDRIKIGRGTPEATAQRYFRELVGGVGFCHAKGVCHRDLKPENLLLSDGTPCAALKIADFGLSAAFAIAASGQDRPPASEDRDPLSSPVSVPISPCSPPPSQVRRLRSVVGSPHYVAPEVTNEPAAGYDGPQADTWSAGVILYAMLAGDLPFGKELSRCPRFAKFQKWVEDHDVTCDAATGKVTVGGSGSGGPQANPALGTSGGSRRKLRGLDVNPNTPSSSPSPPRDANPTARAAIVAPLPGRCATRVGSAGLAPRPPPPPSPPGDAGSLAGSWREGSPPPAVPSSPPPHSLSPRAPLNSTSSSSPSSSSSGSSPFAASGMLAGLSWFFPEHFPSAARALVVVMLHPEPSRRPRMDAIAKHAWVSGTKPRGGGGASEAGQALQRTGLPAAEDEAPLGDAYNAVLARALQMSFEDNASRP